VATNTATGAGGAVHPAGVTINGADTTFESTMGGGSSTGAASVVDGMVGGSVGGSVGGAARTEAAQSVAIRIPKKAQRSCRTKPRY
jgi:hypothetical protein